VVDAIQALLARAEEGGLNCNRIFGGGAVVPASVDPIHGYVRMPPGIRGLQNTNLARDLESAVECILGRRIPFWIENDANGAALAERYFGSAQNSPDFVVIILCTGVGGGLFLNGSLRHGHTFMAGEIGHTTVHPDGPLCPCGGKGCLETLASGRALLRMARASRSPIAAKRNLNYTSMIAAAEAGDKEILGIFSTMGQYLGIGIANVANTLNPSKIILAGHLTLAEEFFLPSTKDSMGNRVFAGMDCDLEVSKFRDDAEVTAGLSTFRYYFERKEANDDGNSS
jgi:glucokinase